MRIAAGIFCFGVAVAAFYASLIFDAKAHQSKTETDWIIAVAGGVISLAAALAMFAVASLCILGADS